MKKKILFLNTSKLAAISAVLLLTVFCVIGMSFRPVYGEDEAEIVMNGPRHSHWKTEKSSTCGGTTVTYHNKNDYGKTSAYTSGGGTVSAYGDNSSSSAKVGSPAVSGSDAGDYVDVTWNCHTGTSSGGDNNGTDKDLSENLEEYHTNNMVFTAAPLLGYKFSGWYADPEYTVLLKAEDEGDWEVYEESLVIPGWDSGYPKDGQDETYEDANSPWYEKKFYAKFEEIPHQTITFLAPSTASEDRGDYDVTIIDTKTTLTTEGMTESVFTQVTLEAHPRAGYGFYGWYSLDEATGERTVIASSNPCKMTFDEDLTIGALIKLRPRNYDITFKAVAQDENGTRMGSYTVKESEELSETVESADYVHNTGSNYDFTTTLTATAADNYIFTGWYSLEGRKKVYHSTANPWNVTLEEEVSIYADFAFDGYDPSTYAQFKVGTTTYSDLNAADAAARTGNNKTIVCSKSGILPPGAYTISAGNTLLIPCNDGNNMYTSEDVESSSGFGQMRTNTFSAVSSYRELTLKRGANITVYGNIYVAGNHLASTQGLKDTEGGAGRPIGPVGRIQMKEGGQITLESGAKLYAFGFITGQDMTEGNNRYDVGTIIANDGSLVYENFILGDMKGGTCTAAVSIGDRAGDYRVFPFNSYFVQNIEVPLYLNYGSEERCVTSIATTYEEEDYYVTTIVPLIAKKKAMFLLQGEGAYIGKWYDATTDHVLYELSGKSKLGNLTIGLDLMGMISININSAAFVLPISNSMHLLLNDCNVKLTNELCLLPGAIMEIQSNSSLNVATNMFLYDTQQWGAYCFSQYFRTYNTPFTSHLIRNGNDMSTIDDAQLIVDGQLTIATTGTLYSTSNGANICGNGGGTIAYQGSSLPANKNVFQIVGSGTATTPYPTNYHYAVSVLGYEVKAKDFLAHVTPVGMQAANLHNEDDTYTRSVAAKTFYNVNGRWFIDGKQNEKEDHTYDFTYIPNTNTGDATLTPAVYSHDKTGLEERMKWANVTAYACNYNEVEYTDWWKGQGDQLSYFYNWTTESDWHQFIKTSTTIQDGDKTKDVYSGSNNKLYLYTQDECNWTELGETDENCLYTIEGEKKALVGTDFIALEPNATDAAYHNASNANEFYICFKGCNWHLATPYTGELKAYTVAAGGTYIWYNDDWMFVERETPFFYTVDESNVRTYYIYKNGEWTIAEPVATVSDALETRSFYFMDQAMDVASKKQNATITLLQDVTVSAGLVFNSTQSTTCILDLNGKALSGAINNLLTISASGSTFTIKSSEPGGVLRMTGKPNNACYYAVNLSAGSLVLEDQATIEVDNSSAHSGENYALCAVKVASGTNFTMKGGTIYARTARRAYGVESNGTTTLEAGTITCQTLSYAYPYGVQVKAGTTTIKNGVTITCTSGTTYAHPVIQTAGTLNVTGGTFRAYAPTSTSADYQASAIRVDGGTANISNATLSAEVTGTGANSKNAYGIYSKGTTTLTNCVASATTKSSAAYGVYVAGGTTTIVSGRYKGAASTSVAGVYTSAGTLTVQGGYYSHATNLAANLAANRGVFATTDAEKAQYGSDMNHKVVEAYTITFLNGESELQSDVQAKGTTPSYTGAEPTKDPTETEEFAFDGWSMTDGGEKLNSLPTVTAAATYYAHFTSIGSKYKVTFDATTNGGTSDVKNVYIDEGAAVGTLPDASKTGHTFNGWYTASTGGTKITSATVPASHVTYYAQFTINSYTLTWSLEGGKVSTAGTAAAKDATGTCSADVAYGTAITIPVVTKTGYTFIGWSSTPASTMPAANATYTASWTANTNTPYKVIHKLQNPDNLEEYITNATENLSGTTGAYVAPAPKTTYVGYITPTAVGPTQILADGSLEIVYLYDCITYTIAYDATTNGGVLESGAPSGVTVVYNKTIPTMPSASKEAHIFDGWFTKAVGGDKITTATPILWNIGTLYAQYSTDPLLEVNETQTINVTRNSEVETTIVHAGGSLIVTTGKTLRSTDVLIIEATPDESGEVIGNVVAENVYFDLTRGAGKVFKHHTWYAFSVPFEVDPAEIMFDGRKMQYHQESKKDAYEIRYYDGAERAAHGKTANCWILAETADEHLYPGKFYMIANTKSDVNTIRFPKVADAPLLTTSVSAKAYASGITTDANWNGIANPSLFHANMEELNTAEKAAWIFNPDYEDQSNAYVKKYLNTYTTILGTPIFVQTPNPTSLVVQPALSGLVSAPRRAKVQNDESCRFQVLIGRDGEKMTDDVIIRMDEEKEEDTYVLGKDLVRMGMSKINPQIWVNRYDEKLCVSVQAPVNEEAEYPLGIFAPIDGEYTISSQYSTVSDQYSLYLTYDGGAIWNLTEDAYIGSFTAGTTNAYGLRIVSKKAPQIATGIDEAVVDAKGETRKVMINNQVFIIRGNRVYSIDGQLVK